MEGKFKLGQKVRVLLYNAIRLNIKIDTDDHVGFSVLMKKYCGNVYRVSDCVNYHGRMVYRLNTPFTECCWTFEEWWLQEVNDNET